MEFEKLPDLMASHYYAIPDYQRDYSWMDQHTNNLFEDIAALLKHEEEGPHFLGAIVTIPYEKDSGTSKAFDFREEYSIPEKEVRHVVDGQQRLTTLTILCKALIEAFDDAVSSDEMTIPLGSLRNRVWSCVFGDESDDADMPAPKLILNGNSGCYLANRILGVREDDCNGSFSGPRRMEKAYKNFKESISALHDECVIEKGIYKSSTDFYKALMSTITKEIQFVEIECDTSANAFQVFDSLNGKGLDLTAADRIRNTFMSWCNKAATKSGKQKWDSLESKIGEKDLTRFFSCLMYYKRRKRVNKRRIPEEFSEQYKETAVKDFDYFYKEIKRAAEIYSTLRQQQTGIGDIDTRTADLITLRQEQAFVMLLAAPLDYCVDKDQPQTFFKDKDYLEFVDAIINLVVRMQVCQKATNRLDTIFSDALARMANEESLKVVTERIRQSMKSIAPDSDFKRDFSRLTIKDTKIASYYLTKIENKMRLEFDDQNEFKFEGTGSTTPTVEHIIPQTLESLETWYGEGAIIEDDIADQFNERVVLHIGNMAVMFLDDNSSASNNNYTAKKKVYMEGSATKQQGSPYETFRTIRELVDDYPDSFTHKEVFERAEILANYAARIWV